MLLSGKHVAYIEQLETSTGPFEYLLSEHLRIHGLYWGLTALQLLDASPNTDAVLARCLACRNTDGGFGGSAGHDSHLLATLSAVQILASLDALHLVDGSTAAYIASLRQPDGGWAGDHWGEVDTRFVYCAVSALSLLKALHLVSPAATAGYLARCQNYGTLKLTRRRLWQCSRRRVTCRPDLLLRRLARHPQRTASH